MRTTRYLVACCGAIFAVASFLAGLEVSATTAAPSFGQSVPAVNRVLKSDRMPLVPAKARNAVNGPVETTIPPVPAPTAPKPRLLEGCEPIVSAIGQPPLAQVAGRCVS
jgi:hypothetical protein